MSPDKPMASLLPDGESQPGRRSGEGAQSLWDPTAQDAQRKARPRSALTAQDLEQIEGRGGYSILVVDDNESARYATARGLRAMGYQTVEAAGGAEALTLAEHASAVVLDVHLPDGPKAGHRRVSRQPPRSPRRHARQSTPPRTACPGAATAGATSPSAQRVGGPASFTMPRASNCMR